MGELSVIVKRNGKELAEFDTSSSRLIMHTLHEPDAKRDIHRALRRAAAAADQQWAPKSEDEP